MNKDCPHCKSKNTKKNGHTHNGKQNNMCKDCKRQFVEGGQDWFVSDAQKALIGRLLLERISLAGVARVAEVSEKWLLDYIKILYSDLPNDLNVDLNLPEIGDYLDDRMDEEIVRLQGRMPESCEEYTRVEDLPKDSEDLFGDLEEDGFDWSKDLLIKQVYGKERGARVQVIGMQLDEMWSFVQNKGNKQWIWLALNPINRQIVALHIGGRGEVDAQIFYDSIPKKFKDNTSFFTDYWKAYACVIPEAKHFAVGKDSGLTAYIERFNGTMRQRVSRLVRKGLSFSKSIHNHIGAIKYFICHYNTQCKALHF